MAKRCNKNEVWICESWSEVFEGNYCSQCRYLVFSPNALHDFTGVVRLPGAVQVLLYRHEQCCCYSHSGIPQSPLAFNLWNQWSSCLWARKPLRFAVSFLVLQATSTLSGEAQKWGLYVFAQTSGYPIPSWLLCIISSNERWLLTFLWPTYCPQKRHECWLPFQHAIGLLAKHMIQANLWARWLPIFGEEYGSNHSS